jgi:hypothetical protein
MLLGTRLCVSIEISSSSASELGIVISIFFVFLCFEGDADEEGRGEGPEMVVSMLDAREVLLFRFLFALSSSRAWA